MCLILAFEKTILAALITSMWLYLLSPMASNLSKVLIQANAQSS